MKTRFIISVVLTLVLSLPVFAQDGINKSGANAPFSKGSSSIQIASGFGVVYGYYGSYISLPALTVAYDLGIINHAGPGNIGVGGIVGFKTAYSRGNTYNARWTNFLIGARGTYHLTLLKNEKFDPYAGVIIGVRIYDYKDSYYESTIYKNPNTYNRVYPVGGVFIGAKYYFTKFFGGFVEVGYDISLARIGFSLNF